VNEDVYLLGFSPNLKSLEILHTVISKILRACNILAYTVRFKERVTLEPNFSSSLKRVSRDHSLSSSLKEQVSREHSLNPSL
jgi:hypothetical protein